jgi:hypothetical protein
MKLKLFIHIIVSIAIMIAIFLTQSCCDKKYNKISEGDIIFQTDKSYQSKAIQLSTHSPYSHVAVIFKESCAYYVYEGTQPVKRTLLDKFMARGMGGHYVIKRLKNADHILTSEIIEEMKNICQTFEGKDYDFTFEWSDDRIYCSELVWKIYQRTTGIEIGRLQHLKNFDLTSNEVKEKMKERYGDSIPMDELVISPSAIFNSKLLVTIDSI